MKTPKKPQEVSVNNTPSSKTPKNKNKMNTPKPEKQNLLKHETPKSAKKNKQKDAQKNGDNIMTPMQQKEPKATNKTPKIKTPKPQLQNGAKQVNISVTSENKKKLNDSAESNTLLNKNPKKRTIDEVVSTKKSKVGNKKSQKPEKASESSGINLSDEVIIYFPPGAKCYKSALKQIVDLSHHISNPRTLIVTFKDEADAKRNLPLLQKLQVGHQNVMVTQLVDNIDPLKKVTSIRPGDGIDPTDIHEVVQSSSYSKLVNIKTGQTSGIFVFTFASKEAAAAASAKTYSINNKQIWLRDYFIDANNKEELILGEKKKRKQDVETSDGSAKKKSKISVSAKKEEVNEDDDDEDEDDDNEDEDDDNEDKDDDNEDEDDDDEVEDDEDDDDEDVEDGEEEDDDDEDDE